MRPAAPLGLLVLALLLPGCRAGTGDPEGGPATAPSGFVTQELDRLTFATPSDWREAGETQDPSAPRLTLVAPSSAGQSPQGVVVADLVLSSTRTAADEAQSLVLVKRDVQRAQNVNSRTLELTGAPSAVLVTYDQDDVTGQDRHVEVLVADLPGGGLAVLTTNAAPDLFDAADLASVARTAVVRSAPG